MVLSRLAVIAVAAACVVAAPIGNAQPYTIVMSGLDNPRGMAFAPNGALYVAEAGRGGPEGPANCGLNGANEFRCYGPTGAISRLWKGQQERVVDGLPSHALVRAPALPGSLAGGPNDIAFHGTGGGYVALGLGGGPAFAQGLGNPYFGTLVHMAASGRWRAIADVAGYEFEQNPASGPLDSNGYGVLAEPGQRLVVDAGANALFRVAADGTIETLAVFPPRPNPTNPRIGPPMVDAVPTSVARGPDGALYVGQLTGFPFLDGFANVYRVVPGQSPTVHCSGFRTVTDIAFDAGGFLYVVEFASAPFLAGPGRLLRVAADCTRTVVVDGLDHPTSVVVAPDGAVYVTNKSIMPGVGEVLKIVP